MFILFAIYPLYLTTNNSDATVSAIYAEYKNVTTEATSLDVIALKLDVIARMLYSNAERTRNIYSLVLTFIAPLFMFLSLKYTRKTAHSFIVLNAVDEARRKNLLAKEKRSLPLMVGAYFFAILSGIIGNYVFNLLNGLSS